MIRPTPFRRFFLCLLACGASAAASALLAQTTPSPKPRVEFTTLAVAGGVTGVFYDLGRERIAVSADPTALSRRYLAPETGSVQLYRLGPPVPPAEGPAKVPVASLSLTGKGPYILLFSGSSPDRLAVRALDNSWENNPLSSSRVINGARRRLAVKLDIGAAELAPGEIHVFAPPAKPSDVVDLKIATLDGAGWNLRSLTPQPLYPYTRNIFIIKEQIPTTTRPDPLDIDIFTIVDASPAPVVKP